MSLLTGHATACVCVEELEPSSQLIVSQLQEYAQLPEKFFLGDAAQAPRKRVEERVLPTPLICYTACTSIHLLPTHCSILPCLLLRGRGKYGSASRRSKAWMWENFQPMLQQEEMSHAPL